MDSFERNFDDKSNSSKIFSPFEEENSDKTINKIDINSNLNIINFENNHKKLDKNNNNSIVTNNSTEDNSKRTTILHYNSNNNDKNHKKFNISSVKSSDIINEEWYPGNSLEEPIFISFKRDILRIFKKIKFVVKLDKNTNENNIKKELFEWDMWGPFILCLILAW